MRQLAAVSRDPIGLVDRDLRILWANPAAIRLAGLGALRGADHETTMAELSSRSDTWPEPSLISADGTPTVVGWHPVARHLLATAGTPCRIHLQRHDGAEATFDCHAIPHGARWLVTAVPTISQAELDARILDAESKYKSLIEHVPGAFYRCDHDPDWTMILLSDAIEGITGYPASDFVGNRKRTITSIVHPEDLDRVFREVDRGVAERRSFDIEYRIIHRDGRVRWVEETGAGVFGADGQLLHLDGFLRDISDSRQARALLKASEAEAHRARQVAEATLAELQAYRAALDHHALVVVTCGRGRILRVNERLQRRLGYAPDELTGRSFRVLDAGEANDSQRMSMFEHVAKDAIWHGELQLRTRSGLVLWVNATIVPMMDARTGATQRVAILEDITSRKEAALRVAEDKQRLQLALDGGDLGLWDWDIAGERVSFDSRWASMLGEDVRDLRPDYDTWASRVHPDDLDDAIARLDGCFEGQTERYEWTGRMRHKAGGWRWIFARGRVVSRAPDGAPLRIVGTHADVTANVEAKQALTEQLDKLEAAERQTRMGHWSLDLRTEAVTWSHNLFALHDRPREAGQPSLAEMAAYFDEASQATAMEATSRCIRTRQPYRIRLCTIETPGRWFECSGRCIEDDTGEVVALAGTRIEITDRVASEEALKAAMARVEAATQAKSEFLARMSHEIRSPLTAILGYAELLQDELYASHPPPSQRESIDSILLAGRHLLAIIQDILDISKIEAGQLALDDLEIPLRPLLTEVLSLSRPRADAKGLSLMVSSDTALPTSICGDPKRLRQILVNLVSNAVKFTESGSVRIVIRAEPEEDPSWLVFDVVDTGIGIDDAAAEALFSPFAQGGTPAAHRDEGTGLGLSISRQLATMMGGTVRLLWSEAGRGSAFRLEVPLRLPRGAGTIAREQLLASSPATEIELTSPSAPTQLSGRVLVVDDERMNQALFRRHLEKAGAEVALADDGREALAAIHGANEAGRPFDLILTDVQMPDLDGHALTRTLRAEGCATPIIALTARAMSEDRALSLEAGCDDYISKPVDREALLRRCAEWLGRRSPRANPRG